MTTKIMSKPRTFVRTFQSRFAPKVECGEKLQTVRKWPKRMPEEGDLFDAREWTGKAYRSKQRKLFPEPKPLTRVSRVKITENGVYVAGLLTNSEAFAKADGFNDFEDMIGWFRETHDLPFEGVLFSWAND